ncbi:RecBCD enzyme subunit RecD [Buchnera aphidicola (Sipha maydis)]|uniref:exodeoxyribonuclease V subunit alpha n=1 Tax=Buchnera aphidicola TaxID=9 RepID=UPI002543DBFD|nr:exodeoxyribonuclease V subunit alpha [Buchnera aphidicola]WII23578.1 exodeoxyribonuclease V subunit alpha [Buchnera aphidicola (Sipha maydis)]
MIKLLKKLIKKKKIRIIDYIFAKEISQNSNTLILVVSVYMSIINRIGNTCISLKNILQKKFFSKKILKKIHFKKNIEKELLKYKNIASNKNTNVPLIIENNHLHLHKIWHIENKIYKFFTKPYQTKKYSNIIWNKIINDKVFINLNIEKKIVILLCFLKKFLFIIGSPGTGKTTLAAKIIYFYIHILKKKNIILSAPTGKASYHLLESIKKNLFFLFKKNKYKKYVPNTSFTIHRLFKMYHTQNIFLNQKKKNIDLLIIDESSMIDIFMLEKIIDNISRKTQIIFLGDNYQLPSINPGSIIHDFLFFYQKENLKKLYNKLIYECNNQNLKKKNTLKNNIFILKKKYRFKTNSDIDQCAKIIKTGNIKNIKNIFKNRFKKIHFFKIKNTYHSYKNMIKKIFSFFKKFFTMIKNKDPIKKILKYFNDKRILCIQKKGFLGIRGINEFFEKLIKKKYSKNFFKINEKKWYIGKPIIILKNIKNMKLFNGITGITLLDENQEKKIFFLMPDHSIKIIPINLIKHYKTTWAITVHKSQGSEFSKIHLILPLSNVKIMTREIIYTAITRAKKKVYIYSKKKIFIKSIKKNICRKSGLYQKFKKLNIKIN